MKYRPEVDGLRAVAVISVVLFHARFPFAAGGFVGVDVFFVISGYLITTLIARELSDGAFRLSRFYERRARRILPALLFVVAVCVLLAWMFIDSGQMSEFSQSLISVATFSSNIHFWRTNGYFSTPAELKPLLHTWSLSVEEQYYLIFPPFLILAWRFGRKWVAALLAILLIASLALAEWGIRHKPVAAFYLLPTRGFELLIGALAALYLLERDPEASGAAHDFAGALGLAMILGSVVLFDASFPLPGLISLVPTLGAVLIILFGHAGTVAHALLRAPPFVGVGLISYSLYLWHQPLLAIVRHATQAEPSRSIHIALIAIAFLAAFMTWKHVETPWRRGGRVSARAIAALSIVGLSAIAIVGRIGHAMGGFPAVPPVADLATPGSASRPVPRIMLLGDSHAGHLYPGLDAVMSGRVIERTRAGCTTLIDLERHDRRSEPGACVRFTRDALDEFLSSPSLDRLVVSMMGPVYFDNTTFHGNDEARVLGQRVELVGRPDVRERWRMFEIGLRDTLALLDRHADKHVVFVLDVPELGRPVCPRSSKAIHLFGLTVGDLVRSADPESCRVPRSEFDRRNETYHRAAQRVLAEFPRVSLVDPTDLFCDAQWCNGFIEGTGYIYRDYDHLNRAGSVLVARTLRRYLRDPADPTL